MGFCYSTGSPIATEVEASTVLGSANSDSPNPECLRGASR